jgi:peptidyl-prolyl cis-trans isomerase NIMA-interacting 1
MRAHHHAAAGTDGRSGSSQRAAPPKSAGLVRLALLLGATLLALACSQLTEPPAHRRTQADAPIAEAPTAPSPAAAPTQVVAEKTPLVPVPTDQIEASHILVSYQGATRAKPTVTRTREQALELATQLAARAREPAADFAQLAKDVSDGPSGVEGGVLPRFGRQQMVKPFSDAAFALRPGEISGVVETNFGFHIIKRLQ